MIVSRRAGRLADLLDVDETTDGLDLSFDSDVADRKAVRLLHLREEEVEGDHLRRALHLRKHDLVETLAGARHDLDHVTDGPFGVPCVDPHAKYPVVPLLLADRLYDLCPGSHLLHRRHGVLEVEERHVGLHRRCLRQEFLVRPGRREARSARQVAAAF